MISRRVFLTKLSATALLCRTGNALGNRGFESDPVGEGTAVSPYVDLMIGTGGHGHTFPGATVPFGMVQLSPDTFNQGWDWCAGYHHSDSSIMGFSHTHLSGTGIGDMLDVLVMPGTGPAKLVPGSREVPNEGYRSRFSHEDELAVPGYYSVLLHDHDIRAELSATARAGIHRYTFPQSDTSHFIVDFAHGYGDPRAIEWAELKLVGKDTLVGSRKVNAWAKGREIYFAMRLSRPFVKANLFVDDIALEESASTAKGVRLKCLFHYHTTAHENILIKTGISGVSVEGALSNLDAEIPGWDFDGVKHAAASRWETELSKIRVEGGTAKQRKLFYTSLYHTMLAPTLFDDVDGRYRGMDGKIHQLEPGTHNYSTFSLWDTYRAAHPLFTLTQSQRVPDFINCLLRMSEESPVGMPVWPLQGRETECMTGYHSAVVIAEAIAKGFQGIDPKRAYSVMRREAMNSDYNGLDLYRKYGYIPCDLAAESIGKSLDYAYNDWAVAQVAKAAGVLEDASSLGEHAKNYRNLFIGQYAHGNEPSHHIAYLYVYAGAPYKTQERVVELVNTMYDDQPDGLAGNEDCGQMSAWYVMSAMGFYAVDPVSANYVFGAPIFQRVTVDLGNGKRLVLKKDSNAAMGQYIQAIRFNDQPHPALWFRHAEIQQGGEFIFQMSKEPQAQFGSSEALAPPSLTS
jgi:predicted alpha-1,2-mannosidase